MLLQIPFNTPKVKIALVLAVLSLSAIINFFSFELLIRFLALIFVFLGIEYLFWKIRKIEPFFPSASLVSANIIFLLSDPSSQILPVLSACLFAIAVKQFLRPRGAHIFNPAVFGLVCASFFGLPISWWGVSWGVIPLILTVLGAGYISLVVVRQHLIIIPFLISAFLLSAVYSQDLLLAGRQLLGGSYWFFALVMLPEPITSAHYPKTRLIYGVWIAVLQFVLGILKLPVEPLLTALLAGNIMVYQMETPKFLAVLEGKKVKG